MSECQIREAPELKDPAIEDAVFLAPLATVLNASEKRPRNRLDATSPTPLKALRVTLAVRDAPVATPSYALRARLPNRVNTPPALPVSATIRRTVETALFAGANRALFALCVAALRFACADLSASLCAIICETPRRETSVYRARAVVKRSCAART